MKKNKPAIINGEIRPYFRYALLSAFANLPNLGVPKAFFDKEVKTIFTNYQDSLERIRKLANKSGTRRRKSKEEKFLYKPIPYCLFGDFDLGVFSMIDDFSFATKKFKPSPESYSFKYQINTGIIPKVEVYKKRYSLISKFEDEDVPKFFTDQKFFPFTGVVSIKLNSAMLVGIGQEFVDLVNTYIVAFIDDYKRQRKAKGLEMFFMINENLGWNELTIYFFSNSIKDMNDIMVEIRNNTLGEMVDYFKKLRPNSRYNKDELVRNSRKTINKIKNSSLLSKLILCEKGKPTNYDFLKSHPVLATSITYGFRAELLNLSTRKSKRYDKSGLSPSSKVLLKALRETMVSIAWNIKPGHESTASRIISKYFRDIPFQSKDKATLYSYIQTGRHPFVFPPQQITLEEYLRFLSTAIKEDKSDPISNQIFKFKSRVSFSESSVLPDENQSGHYYYDLKPLRISTDEIKEIHKKLRVYPIPHTLKSQIENIVLNFNEAISDPLIFNYFIGMKETLMQYMNDKFFEKDPHADYAPIKKDFAPAIDEEDGFLFVAKLGKKSDEIITPDSPNVDNLSSFIQAWNKAYWNRYFHSYYFTELSDFNIEHHGGVQQILFAYDRIYKLLEKRIYGIFAKSSFVNVQVSPTISSTQYYNNINFTHLFRPAVFACECVHEVANHIIACLVLSLKKNQYNFLMNPKSDSTPFDITREMKTFEASLKRSLGAKDNFEMEYLESNFGLNLLRQVVTDYATFKIAYEEGGKNKHSAELPQIFYFAHWFLMLTRANLYTHQNDGKGAWFFREDEFRNLFIRFNLMFYLMLDFSKIDLIQLNRHPPSIELSTLWKTESGPLIDFVCRLGDALRIEFKKRIKVKSPKAGNDKSSGMKQFRLDIDENFIHTIKTNLNPGEAKAYANFISFNYDLIKSFYDFFYEPGSSSKNILIRRSAQNDIQRKGKEIIIPNISFHNGSSRRWLFLDPKGNLFTTTPEARKDVFYLNIQYIKNLWSLAMKTAINAYKI